ncbi:response regulator transcription factor, partial [Streptococcus suis]
IKSFGKPSLSFIGLNGEPSFIDVQIGEPLFPFKEKLTKREKEILLHIIDGKLNKQIATILNISKETVDKHRKNMIEKANCSNSGELIAMAIKNGW